MAASLLINHQLANPDSPPPFKLAIFICGSLPYCINESDGVDVARLFAELPASGFGPVKYISYQPESDDGSSTARPLLEKIDQTSKDNHRSLAEVIRSLTDQEFDDGDEYQLNVNDAPEPGVAPSDSSSDTEGDSPVFSPLTETGYSTETKSVDTPPFFEHSDVLSKLREDDWNQSAGDHTIRRFHADNDLVRLEIPTAHIVGKTDPYMRQGLELHRLCDPQWSTLYEHPEGHIVPRSSNVNMQIAAAIEKAIAAVEISAR